MEHSIEHIWKNGFLKENALVAPKINDLYNQKSQNLITKIKRMMKLNMYIISFFAFVILLINFVLGFRYIGLIVFVLLLYIVFISKKQWDKMQEIDMGSNSYTYLKLFDNWLKNSIAENIKLMRVFYPVFFLTAISSILIAFRNEKITNEFFINSEMYLVQGIPLVLILGALGVAGVISYYSDYIYQFDINLMYGKVFKKLKNTIADMEELIEI